MFPPGPRGGLLLGSLPDIRRDPLSFLSRVSAQYGDIAHFRLGPFHVYLLNHPDDIEQVLVTQHHRYVKGRSLSGARRLFGYGLLTSDAAQHARQRRMVQPTFHRVRLDDYGGIIAQLGADRRDSWREGQTVDIAREMSRLTLAITSRILFGGEGDAVAAEIADPLEAATSLLEVAVLPFAAFTDLLPLPQVRRFRAARAALDRVMNDLIERRRRDGNGSGDVVTLLMSARDEATGERMSDSELRDELVTLLLASHETTANALAWTWYLLALHRATTRASTPRSTLFLEKAAFRRAVDVPDLRYTRMVLAESMRLYPPAWLLARVSVEDHDVRGYLIPRGSLVVLSPWVVHRSSTYFPEPERFEPERWRPERQDGNPRFSYFPFGGGSRGCMGEAFAWMEGVLLVAIIAQRWRFRLLDELLHPDMHPALTLTPKSGIRVKVERRS